MGTDNAIEAEWISPLRLKRYFFLNMVVSFTAIFLKFVMAKLQGYDVSGNVFLDRDYSLIIMNIAFRICGVLSIVVGAAFTVLSAMALHANLGKGRVMRLATVGIINFVLSSILLN